MSVGVLALPPALLATYLRVVPPDGGVGEMAASFVAYGLIGYVVSLVCFVVALLRARRRVALGVIALVVAALTALQISWQVPFFVADDRPATTAPITVLTLNLKIGAADPAGVWAQAQHADIVLLQEFAGFDPTRAAGTAWSARFPYSAGYAGPPPAVSADTVIFSRFPLSDTQALPVTKFAQWVSVATVPGIGDVTVMAVHPCSPLCGPGVWQREHDVVRAVASLHRAGPLLIAGDFNAVDDHLPIRQLRRDGLRSATDIVGAGWLPTYPADRSFPPLIPIDHILLSSQLTATSIHRIQVAGTDHRGLVATIAGTG
ncbi:MAG: endonuclease/exonuclease/phosphatase family protein [Propionibacteriaceae bacterium]